MSTKRYVPSEVIAQRIAICRQCDKHRALPNGIEWCGISGRKVSHNGRQSDNLAAYEECPPQLVCKHPLRPEGRGWPMPNEFKLDVKVPVQAPVPSCIGEAVPQGITRNRTNLCPSAPITKPLLDAGKQVVGGAENGRLMLQADSPRAASAALPPQSAKSVKQPPLLFTADDKPVDMENLYRGRSCFLICGGPSFAKHDHSKLRQPGILTMGVNNSPKTFRPNLWACVDNPDHFLRSIWLDPAILKFAPMRQVQTRVFNSDAWSHLPLTLADCPNVFFYKRHCGFDAAKFLTADTCCWGNDEKNGGARSVMFAAIRLLYYLGIRRIFLLGCDFKMSADRPYHFDQARTPDFTGLSNGVYNVLRERFKQLRPVFEAAGLRVFNCNPESKLDAFEKISFDKAVDMCLEEWGNINVATERTAGLYDLRKVKPQPPKQMLTLPKSFKRGLTVITCTRNRPEAFKLLERWMRRQSQKWNQWIVVNDGQQRYEYTLGQEVVARVPTQGEGHSLTANLLTALPRIRHEHIVFVEDDDWIGLTYLKSMSAALKKAPLVGNIPALYYNVATGRWQDMRNRAHASLGQTAMHAKMLPLVAEIVRSGSPWIDTVLWRKWSGKKKFIRSTGLHVGIKGMPGEPGIGIGHKSDFGKRDSKPDFGTLRSWIGEDVNAYVRPKPVVSVSVSTGQTACIITCHNYGKYLTECLQSCLAQTRSFARIIVIDDASNDNTAKVCAAFKRHGVEYVRVEFRDACAARNHGTDMVNTEFVLHVDADNVLSATYVEHLLEAMRDESVAVAYGNIETFGEPRIGQERAITSYRKDILYSRNLADTCSLVRRWALWAVGGFGPDKPAPMHDWALWMKLTSCGWKMVYCPRAVFHYRVHRHSLTRRTVSSAAASYVDTMRGSALVAVVGLFAGRPWALEKYFSWLSRVEWQRLHIVAGDNSCNPEFGEMLRNKLNDLGRPFAYVPLWLQGIEQMSNAEFGESETRRAMGMVGLSNHVARCYNQLAPFIPAGVDFIWIVEDDVEPPDKALEMLMKTFSGRPKLAATCARTIDRTNRAAVEVLAWKDHKALSASSLPRNTVLVDRVSFTCTLIRRDAWDLAPPRQAAGCADWSFSDTAKARGMELLLHGGVQCRHWRSDGSVV